MERKMMSLDTVKTRLGISDPKLRKILYVMRKRHAADDWIIIRKISQHHTLQYIKLEGLDWIESVYYRDPSEYYLDAEIRFANKHIQRLEDELRYSEDWIPAGSMSTLELACYVQKSRTSIKNAINQLSQNHNEWIYKKQDSIMIKHNGIEWILKNIYKQLYFTHLNLYKQKLQQKKERGIDHET